MNAKTLRIGLIAALALTLSATAAFAWGGGCQGRGYGYGQGYAQGYGRGPAQLTPEKQEIYQKLVQEYAPKAEKIRADLVARQAELETLNESPNPDQARIATLAKEVGELHAQLITEQSAFRAKVAKEVGLTDGGFGGGRGYGAGNCPGAGGCPGVSGGNCPGYASNCPGYGGGRGCPGGCSN